jgi:hypothetical protein
MPRASDRIGEIQRELEVNPTSRQFYQLGELLRRAGRPHEAVEILRAGVEHHPRYVAAWVALGRASLEADDPLRADDALRRALDLDPVNPVAWRLLGEALLGQGQRTAALDAMGMALTLAPGDEVLKSAVESLARECEGEGQPAVASAEAPAALPEALPGAKVMPDPEPLDAGADVFALPPAEDPFETPAAGPCAMVAAEPEPAPFAGFGERGRDVFDLAIDLLPLPGAGPFELGEREAAAGGVFEAGEDEGELASALAEQPSEEGEGVAFPGAPVAEAAEDAGALEPLPGLPFVGAPPVEGFEFSPVVEVEAREVAPEVTVTPGDQVEAVRVEPGAVFAIPPVAGEEEEGEPTIDEGAPAPALASAEEQPTVGTKVPEPAAEELLPPTIGRARSLIRRQDLDGAAAVLRGLVEADPADQEARDLLELVVEMQEPLPETFPVLSVRERKIAALQRWLTCLTLARDRASR